MPSGVAIGGNQVKGVAVGRQLDIQVGGAGIHSYRYRLDYGDWSATMSVAQTLRLDEMGDGWHHVEFMGQNRAGNWLDLPEQIRKVDWLRSNETTPIRFSEVFAHSVPWHDDAIMRSEFVELVNLESVRIVLDDYSITDDAQNPSKFQFSPQSLVEARQRFVVGAGSAHSDQGFELPFGLDNKGGGFICSNALVTSISWSIIWYTGGKYLAGLWDAILKGLGGLGLLHQALVIRLPEWAKRRLHG